MGTEEAGAFAHQYLELNVRQRPAFLTHMSRKQCETLRNCVYNLLLNTSIQMSDSDRRYLARHTKVLRLLASKRLCLRHKSQLLRGKAAMITRLMRIIANYLLTEKENHDPVQVETDSGQDNSPASTSAQENSPVREDFNEDDQTVPLRHN